MDDVLTDTELRMRWQLLSIFVTRTDIFNRLGFKGVSYAFIV